MLLLLLIVLLLLLLLLLLVLGGVNRGAFTQLQRAMEHLRPDIPVVGSNYPPSPFIQATCKVVRALQFAGIGLVFAGDHIFSGIGMPAPAWYESVKSNKVPTSVMMWFLGNMVTQNLVSTGAFEVREQKEGHRCCHDALAGAHIPVYICIFVSPPPVSLVK